MNTLTASLTEQERFSKDSIYGSDRNRTCDLFRGGCFQDSVMRQPTHFHFSLRPVTESNCSLWICSPMTTPAISRVIYKNLIQRIRVVLLVDLRGNSPRCFNHFQVKFLTKLPTVFLKLGSNSGPPSKNIDTAAKAFFQLALFSRKF